MKYGKYLLFALVSWTSKYNDEIEYEEERNIQGMRQYREHNT